MGRNFKRSVHPKCEVHNGRQLFSEMKGRGPRKQSSREEVVGNRRH